MDQLRQRFSAKMVSRLGVVLLSFFFCWNVPAETTEVYGETDASVNITEIEDFINKTIVTPEQVVPSGKEDSSNVALTV